jgi:hypothetical protein
VDGWIVSTFLLSWLGKQYGALDASIFLREQPGDWLVLEGVPGSPARAAEPIVARLALRRDRTRYTVGRDPACDLVVDDPEVALSHAVLEQDDDGSWTIRIASTGAAARLDGLALGDFPVALGSGARIDLGGARLTFYEGADLHARLRSLPASRAPTPAPAA